MDWRRVGSISCKVSRFHGWLNDLRTVNAREQASEDLLNSKAPSGASVLPWSPETAVVLFLELDFNDANRLLACVENLVCDVGVAPTGIS